MLILKLSMEECHAKYLDTFSIGSVSRYILRRVSSICIWNISYSVYHTQHWSQCVCVYAGDGSMLRQALHQFHGTLVQSASRPPVHPRRLPVCMYPASRRRYLWHLQNWCPFRSQRAFHQLPLCPPRRAPTKRCGAAFVVNCDRLALGMRHRMYAPCNDVCECVQIWFRIWQDMKMTDMKLEDQIYIVWK